MKPKCFLLSLLVMSSLSTPAFASARTCTWFAHPNSNRGNECQDFGQAGDTITLGGISENSITLSPRFQNQDFGKGFIGTFVRQTQVVRSNAVSYNAFQVDRENQILINPKVDLGAGKGNIILRSTPGDGGCFQSMFYCK